MRQTILLLAVVCSAVVALAGEKQYQPAKLKDIQTKYFESDRDLLGLKTTPHTDEHPIFTVEHNGLDYEGDCYAVLAYQPKEWTVGETVNIRFDNRGEKFWLQRPNPKKELGCRLLKKSKPTQSKGE